MREYITEAIVLLREPAGEADARFTLFAKDRGKMVAKAKSVRKPTSKLAGHLEPGTLLFARMVEKGGLQLVDALKKGKVGLGLSDLAALALLLPELEPEAAVWGLLFEREAGFDWRRALTILGWAPEGAICSGCGKGDVSAFHPETQDFLCKDCASRSGADGLIYI